MSRKKKYSILLALSDLGSLACFEQLLSKQTEVGLNVSVLEDVYSLLSSTMELAPDLVVVSPQVLSDPMVPSF